MNRPSTLLLILSFLGTTGLGCDAPDEPAGEPLTAWEWFQEVQLPEADSARHFDVLLTPSVFDKARADLADLRLYDGRGREVPYVLRVRRGDENREPLSAKTFNQTTNSDRVAQVSLDLGEAPSEHNEVEVLTSDTDFRRRVRVEGSDKGKDWQVLLDKGHVVHFRVESQTVDVRRLRYPASRFRYLRVHVSPDASLDEDKPAIRSVTISRSTGDRSEYATLPALLGQREAVRTDDGPGSAWEITWGGDLAPCERLNLDVEEEAFARTFVVELADPGEPRQRLAAGEWRRRAGDKPRPLEVEFPEVYARRLRLVVTDSRNPPLTITEMRLTAPARQVIFARSEELTPPLRLYFGNPKAEAPRYDFAAELPARIEPAPARATLEARAENPDYQPGAKPLAERWPWLVYVVLGAASLTLLGTLGLLSREALTRQGNPATPGQPPAEPRNKE